MDAGNGMDRTDELRVELASLAVEVTGFLKSATACGPGGTALVDRGRLDALERASLRAYFIVAGTGSTGHRPAGGVAR
jgi:hypothetical protein